MMGAASEAAEREGLTTGNAHSAAENARSAVGDAAQRVRHVVEETVSAGREAAHRELGGATDKAPEDNGGTGVAGSRPAGSGSAEVGGDTGTGGSVAGVPGRAAVQPTIGTSPRVHGHDERGAG
jgi:hypothetical protein